MPEKFRFFWIRLRKELSWEELRESLTKKLTWQRIKKEQRLFLSYGGIFILLAGGATFNYFLDIRDFQYAKIVAFMMMGGSAICYFLLTWNLYRNEEPSFLRNLLFLGLFSLCVIILAVISDSLFHTNFIGWNQELFNSP